MTPITIAIAAQLLASELPKAGDLNEGESPALLVEREDLGDGDVGLSAWLPITADGPQRILTPGEIRRLVRTTEAAIEGGVGEFVVDQFRAGRPRFTSDEGGVAGLDDDVPGVDLRFSIFPSTVLPPSTQMELAEAVAAVEHYFENTVRNALVGPGGVANDVTIRIALRVAPLNQTVPGISQLRLVAVPMSEVTRKLANVVTGSDGDDYQPGLPTYVDRDGNAVGMSALRVRYSGVSTSTSRENRVFLTRAQHIALGFGVSSSGPSTIPFEGTIVMNSLWQWDYDPSDGLAAGQVTRFSFQDYLVREVLAQLGWVSGIDFLQRDLTLLDMYRFSSVSAAVFTIVSPAMTTLPPLPGAGAASTLNSALQSLYETANGSSDFPLDYNPGISEDLLLEAQERISAGTPNIEPQALANLISTEVTCPFKAAAPPSPNDARQLTLLYQLGGVEVAVPEPGATSRPTPLDRVLRFDDGDWPAEPFLTRTPYPDGALPTIVGWPAAPRVRWNFNAPVTLVAAGSTNIVTASTPVAGAQLGLVGGLSVADCDVDTFTSPPNRLLALTPFAPSGDWQVADPFQNRCLQISQNWASDRGITIRCSTAGAAAPSVSFDIRLSEDASSTWRFSYALNGNAPVPTFSTTGLPNGGYLAFTTADAFYCGVRFDMLFQGFTPGANTVFRLVAVPPPGQSAMQSVSQARGGSVPFSSNSTVAFDMVTVSPTIGAQLLVDFNPSFRGHMPRLVSRGTRSLLNFAMSPERSRSVADTQFTMWSGNAFGTARASFVSQDSAAVPVWERFLMGQSSIPTVSSIPRGVSFWTRDPDAYRQGGIWKPLGFPDQEPLPDFLSEQELLILDHLGWDISGIDQPVYRPAPIAPAPALPEWDLQFVGEQLHPPQPAYDPTGTARQ
jgi:hypothetical protein